jgi:hypothetical protein
MTATSPRNGMRCVAGISSLTQSDLDDGAALFVSIDAPLPSRSRYRYRYRYLRAKDYGAVSTHI